MALMAGVSSTNETFTESKTMAVLREPLRLSGKLAYHRPDHLEKHVLSPYEEHLIVEGNKLTLTGRDGKTKRISLSRYPMIQAFVESIRGTLAGDADVLRRFYRVDLTGDRGRWTLRLRPLDQEMAEHVESIELNGSDAQVIRVVVQEAGGDNSVMMIHRDAS